VLWKMVEAFAEMRKEDGLNIKIAIYTADAPREHYRRDLLNNVKRRFSISIPVSLPLIMVHLHDSNEEEDNHRQGRDKPRSMIIESIESIKMAWNAMNRMTPDIFFDTTGCAFSYTVARILAGCRVAAYVHYPTISTDMLSVVWEQRPTYNNHASVSQSRFYTYVKLLYYSLFALAYGFVGSLASIVLCNSTWTLGHIRSLWFAARRNTVVLYPPCDVSGLSDLPLEGREQIILSVGQFRPEKAHALQIRSFARALKNNPGELKEAKLVMVGSCRNNTDQKRVDTLLSLTKHLGIEDKVQIVVDAPHCDLKDWFARASVGIHSMWNEHFGIGVVEMMASGLVTIAHRSGGPKSDIILRESETGYLSGSEEEYADILYRVLVDGPNCEANRRIRKLARDSAKQFSDEVFMKSFKNYMRPFLRQ